MWFYWYKVYWFDDFDNKQKTEEGITVGKTVVDAMEKIASYYGEKAIDNVEIRIIQSEMENVITDEEFVGFVAKAKTFTVDF